MSNTWGWTETVQWRDIGRVLKVPDWLWRDSHPTIPIVELWVEVADVADLTRRSDEGTVWCCHLGSPPYQKEWTDGLSITWGAVQGSNQCHQWGIVHTFWHYSKHTGKTTQLYAIWYIEAKQGAVDAFKMQLLELNKYCWYFLVRNEPGHWHAWGRNYLNDVSICLFS